MSRQAAQKDFIKVSLLKEFSPLQIKDRTFSRVYFYDPSDYPEYSMKGYIDEVAKFAEVTGQLDKLLQVFERLEDYSDRPHVVRIYKDYAPYSFAFSLYNDNEDGTCTLWFSGGIIYHGPHDGYGDGGAPTFSVSLSNDQGWSIHT